MLAVRLVRLIENHIEQLSQDLSEKVWNSPRCSDLNKVPRSELQARTREIYRNLSDWLLDKAETQVEHAASDACVRQDIHKSARFNQAIINSIGKPQAKAHKPAMKVSILPYNGKRQVSRMRTTPMEIGISAHDQAHILIGPVQEIKYPILSEERRVSQSVAAPPSIGQFQSFGGCPFVALNPFQSAVQLPDNESLRMNLTTTQALHEGNCATGCP
ncbi:MAG: hypothetical protein ABI684_02145 [Nitrospirota bacterium]